MKRLCVSLACLLLSGGALASGPVLDGTSFADAYCSGSSITYVGDLVAYEGPTQVPELTVNIEVTAETVRVDGVVLDSVQSVGDGLLERRDEAVALSERPELTVRFAGRLSWFVAPDVRADRIAELASIAAEADFVEFLWIVHVGDAATPPPFAVPELGTEVVAALAAAPEPVEQQRILAELTARETRGCRASKDLLEARAFAPAEMKCPLTAAGIDEVIARCPKKAPRIITLLQVPLTPYRQLGAIKTVWAADAEAVRVPAAQPWSELVAVLAAHADAPLQLALDAPPASADPLVGTWQMLSADGDGGPESADITWTFDGSQMTEREGDGELSAAYVLDLTADPPRFELAAPAARAIFRVTDDQLLIQLEDHGGDWPTDFEVSSPHTLLELRRVEAP